MRKLIKAFELLEKEIGDMATDTPIFTEETQRELLEMLQVIKQKVIVYE